MSAGRGRRRPAVASQALTSRMFVRQHLAHLVLSEETLGQIGSAVNSARSIFLFGPSGDGKTTIADSIGRMLMNGDIYIPYAFAVDGHVVKVFDEANHRSVEEKPDEGESGVTVRKSRQRDEGCRDHVRG